MIALRKTSQKIVILSCIVIILTFNISTSYVKANSWAAEFADESIASYFASVMTTVSAVGASAAHVEDYITDQGKAIYDTAKATWPKLSADMQANFRQSMSASADGIIAAGDWITAGLDALKSAFGGNHEKGYLKDQIVGDSTNTFNFASGVSMYVAHPSFYAHEARGSMTLTYHQYESGCGDTITIRVSSMGTVVAEKDFYKSKCKGSIEMYNEGLALMSRAQSTTTLTGLKAIVEATGAVAVLKYNGTEVVPTNNSYNRIDDWLRDVAIPAGTLGVYAPAEAWTTNGYKLGLSTDGQQLLTLPDGLPYDPAIHGQYSWRQPLTQVIDGVPAVLNPTTWDWVNARDKTIVRPAEIPEIAEYVGTDVDTAEKIKNQTKGEEGTTNGKLKNPTKKLVWTPLMMTGDAMTKKFPFSIPWDFANQLKVFDVSPEAPKIEINKPNFFTVDGQKQSMIWTIDFSYLNPIAAAVRWFAIIAFDIGLILMIRRIMPE